MSTNAKMFWILAAFFVVADAGYITWSLVNHAGQVASMPAGIQAPQIEWVGAVSIGLTAVLSGFLAFYLGRSHGSTGGALPEDRLDAEIDDGDAEQGFFSPWSWWPILLALGAAVVFLGMAVGFWVCFIGVGLAFISLVGWVYEYYRGNFAR